MIDGPRLRPASGGKARQLVVLLHGFGADGEDLIGLAPHLQPALPDALFISPNGPQPCTMAGFGRQWFPLTNFSNEERLAGARTAAPILNEFLDAELEKAGLTDESLALIGFSQGCMMALHVGLRRPSPCAGIIGYSGALAGVGPVLEAELTSRPPVLLVHGDADPVVPVAALKQAVEGLNAVQVPVHWHVEKGLPHSIGPEGLGLGLEFLRGTLLRQLD